MNREGSFNIECLKQYILYDRSWFWLKVKFDVLRPILIIHQSSGCHLDSEVVDLWLHWRSRFLGWNKDALFLLIATTAVHIFVTYLSHIYQIWLVNSLKMSESKSE